MGLDLHLFEDPIDPSLICGICRKVLVDPVSNSCQHIFCQSCIKKRLKSAKSKFCPECSTPLQTESSEVSVELKLQLLRLRIKCNHQCGAVCLLADLPDHVSDVCPDAPVVCPNKGIGCTKTVRRRDVGLHEEECYYRYVDCEACGLRVQYCDVFTHQSKTRCLEKKLRQQVARAAKSTNMEVRRHRDNVLRQNMQLERLQRQAVMKQFRSKQPNHTDNIRTRLSVSTNGDLSDDVFSETGIQSSCKDSLSDDGEQCLIDQQSSAKTPHHSQSGLVLVTCRNCRKPFRETSNHSKACTYHAGPIIDLFGGTCYNCGRMDYQHGCMTSSHVQEKISGN